MHAVKVDFMEKWLCYGAMGLGALALLLFLLDAAAGVPFGRVSVVVDVLAILAGGLVLSLGYDAYRDLR
jgi:hypothetical protein